MSQQKQSTTEQKQAKNDSNFLQGCLGCLGVSVVLIIGFMIFIIWISKEDNGKPVVNQQPKQTAETQNMNTGNNTEQKVRGVIVDVVGKKNNLSGERIISLQVNNHVGTATEGDKIVIATLLADDAGGSTKSRMQFQAIDMFKKLFTMSEIEEVTIIWQFPLVDTYGKAENKPVMKITIVKATATKINWENFDRNNFKKVANAYFEHTALQNDK